MKMELGYQMILCVCIGLVGSVYPLEYRVGGYNDLPLAIDCHDTETCCKVCVVNLELRLYMFIWSIRLSFPYSIIGF